MFGVALTPFFFATGELGLGGLLCRLVMSPLILFRRRRLRMYFNRFRGGSPWACV